jgi:FAD/FMN-containing dehydrogenase
MAADGRYHGLQGFVVPNSPEGVAQATGNAFPDLPLPIGAGMWLYMIEGARYYAPGGEPDTSALIDGLSHIPSAVNVLDLPYAAYIARLDVVEAALRQVGMWDLPHPWIDLFVPRSSAAAFIRSELAQITPADVAGPILVYPYRRSAITTPNFPLPDGEEIVLFALLRTALPRTPERVAQLWAANYDIYARCLDVGGTGYAIDAVPLTTQDWRRHFGARWPALVQAKQRYDPARILAPGQKVF